MIDSTAQADNKTQDTPDRKTNKILVNVVLDRSGSMGSVRKSTVDGYNEYLNGLRADKASEYDLTLIQFDMTASTADLTVSYVDKPLTDIADLTMDDYVPRGSTPLYDAIGECIRRVEAKDRGVITLIITDGHENASIEFTRDSVKALIAEKEKQGWAFAFLGANIDSYAVGGSIGLSAQSVSNYAVGNEGVAFKTFAQSTNSYAHASARVGTLRAAAGPRFTRAQQSAMGGAPPPSASSFRPGTRPIARPAITTTSVGGNAKPRKWTESSKA